MRIVADTATLGNGLHNSYAEHVLPGKPLPVNYSTHIAILQRCGFPTRNVRIARAASRLQAVSFNFDIDHSSPVAITPVTSIWKGWSSAQHAVAGIYDINEEIERQVQIGSKMCPEYPCRSLSQALHELHKAMGIASSSYHIIFHAWLPCRKRTLHFRCGHGEGD